MVDDMKKPLERAAHGLWSQPGVPHRGWTCVGIDDIEEPSHICEMCQVTPVRYVHTMTHPDYPRPLDVGCICAAHMEGDYAGDETAARERERPLRNRASRRERWPFHQGWRFTKNRNRSIKVHGVRFVIKPHARAVRAWAVAMIEDGKAWVGGKTQYSSELEAQMAVFDWLNPRPRSPRARPHPECCTPPPKATS